MLPLKRFVNAGVNLPIRFLCSPEGDYQPSIHRMLMDPRPGQ
jgi:hypothetical protein